MTLLSPFIKWSGSKQPQARNITSYFPRDFNAYYEPFLGGGAVLGYLKPKKAICADINAPLISLWKIIQKNPEIVIKKYEKDWGNLQKEGHIFFYKVRESFNIYNSPHDLLFLSRTCVNGLIRYNRQGKFNNSFHHTRRGIHPERLAQIIKDWSKNIKDYNFLSVDYREATKNAKQGDLVYLDPPYFNTRGRYFGTIDYGKFIDYLSDLNIRGIKFALSYDGKRGEQSYVIDIPKNLYKRHMLIHSGNSAFNKVQNGKVEKVYESLYLNY